jgi:hypothetical protein
MTMKNVTTTMMMLAGTVAGASLPAIARADDGCSIYRVGIPDFDQRRRAQPPIEGLPGNGSMFCAPTAATNMIGYLDRLGYPNFIPGGNWNWFGGLGYDQATAAIAEMGVDMGTDAEDGTTNGYAGLRDFVERYYPDEFVVTYWDSPSFGPTPLGMRNIMLGGSLVYFCYGRYSVEPAGNGLPARRVRQGGHCVTLNEIINACTDPVIGYRDPGSGGSSDTTQSGFATARWNVGPWTTWYAGDEDDQPVFKTNYILEGDFDDGRIRAIDGARIIWPLEGLSVDATEGILSAQKFIDLNLGLTNGVRPTHHLLPAIRQIREAATRVHRHSALPYAVVALDGDTGGRDQPGLWRCNLATREWLRLAPMPPGGGGGCFGPDGRFFFGVAGGLRGIDCDNPTVNPIDVPTSGHTVLACAAGDPDHDGDRDLSDYPLFYMTRNSAGGLFIAAGDVDGDGCSPYQPRPLPTAIPVPGGCDIDVNPVDGTLLVAPHGSRILYRIDRPVGSNDWIVIETLTLPCVPKSVHFDNKGRIVFCCDGTVNVFERNPANGQWQPKRDSRWAGLPGGDAFVMSRSRQAPSHWANSRGNFNIDPAAENRILNNPGTPDCPADFNNDGFLDFFDYDLFVECFEGVIESCPANNPPNIVLDVNNDGFVDFFDYNDFVELFERGC